MIVWVTEHEVYGPFEDANEAFAWVEGHRTVSRGGHIRRVTVTKTADKQAPDRAAVD